MSYRVDQAGSFVGGDQSWAWGPDLSGVPGGAGGAGGIGGLAVYSDDSVPPDTGAYQGPMLAVFDGQGNVTRLCKSDGGVAANYEYGPFGECRSITGVQGNRNAIRWSSKFTDSETGLVYYGFRYYSPDMGRWISRDPIGERSHCNRFATNSNRPIDRSDPFGLWEYISDAGYFLGSFGKSTTANRWSSDFTLTFVPDKGAFDQTCRDCKDIRFLQLYKGSVSGLVGYGFDWIADDHWHVDAGGSPPFYDMDQIGSSIGPAPASMHDRPEVDPNWSQQVRPIAYHHEFETCAVCASGSHKDDVYGCVRWSHHFYGWFGALNWTRTFDGANLSAVWSSVDPPTNVTGHDRYGRIYTQTLSATTPTLNFHDVRGLEPSGIMATHLFINNGWPGPIP